MKKQTTMFLMTFLCAAAAAVGCSSSSSPGDAGSSSIPLVPDPDGFVDIATTGDTGIQGAWYAYGDGIGATGMPPGDCQNAGHLDSECSKIETPVGKFTNTAGKMCTKGTVAKIIGMTAMPLSPDYAKIWGAGIGLDLNNPGGAVGKSAIDATAKGLKGIEFDLDMRPLPGLRVEVEATDTNGSEAGNDYWGATASYPPSPVMAGTNTITWDKFVGPKGHVFSPSMLRGIQFHVPASTTAAGTYEFCISNMKVLK
jgi:hypothetical protein